MTEQTTKDVYKCLLNDYSFTMLLIREVKIRTELWLSSSPEYWNMRSKQKSRSHWADITQNVQKRFRLIYENTKDITVNAIRGKWDSLRMDYCKFIRQTVKVPSTSKATKYFEEMQFLAPLIISSKQDIENILKCPADVIDSPLTELNAEIFYQSVFNDGVFLEVLIGEIEDRPILWDSRLPGYSNDDAWHSLMKDLDGSFSSLDPKIQFAAVSSLQKTWYNPRNSYLLRFRDTGLGCTRNNAERFADQLEFVKPVIKEGPYQQIPHDDAASEQVSTSEDISYSKQGHSALNIPYDEINLSSFQQDYRSQKTESSTRIPVTCEKGAAFCFVPFCRHNSSAISANGQIPNNSHEYMCNANVPSSMAFPSNENHLNNFPEDCRSLVTESPSKITATCEKGPASSAITFCEYNSSAITFNEHIPNNFHQDISSEQVPASTAFPSYEHVSNSCQQDSRSRTPEQFPKITSQSAQFPSSSVIASCVQNSPDVLSYRHIPNNVHEDMYSAQGTAFTAFSSSEKDPNRIQQESISWIPEQPSVKTAPSVQFPSSSVISSCTQISSLDVPYRHVKNNFQPVTSCEQECSSNKTEEFGCISYKNETNQEFS